MPQRGFKSTLGVMSPVGEGVLTVGGGISRLVLAAAFVAESVYSMSPVGTTSILKLVGVVKRAVDLE